MMTRMALALAGCCHGASRALEQQRQPSGPGHGPPFVVPDSTTPIPLPPFFTEIREPTQRQPPSC
eukprot:3878759-Rhodomonas_salina.3